MLGHDVGDGLATERGVQHVRRDLGVEGDRRRRCVGIVRDARDEQRLDLVADDRDRETIKQPTQGGGIVGPLHGYRAAVAARERQGEGRSAAWPRIVEEQADPHRRLGRQPRLQGRDALAGVDLDPGGVGDRRRERCRQITGRIGWLGRPMRVGNRTVRAGISLGRGPVSRGRGPVSFGRAPVPIVAGRWRGRHRPRDRVEIERQLEATPLAGRAGGTRVAPAGGTGRRGDASGRHRAVGRDTAQRLRGVAGRFAGHRRQALDERPELVLAEQPDDRLAVVVAEPGGLQIHRDRQVADDGRQALAHEDLIAMLDELVAQLVRLDIDDPLVERLECPELADELGGRLLPNSWDPGDVVAGIALERLVVDHLSGHQLEPLHDPGRVVEDRVLNPGAGGHEPGLVGHELKHVQVAGDDRRIQATPLSLHDERADDVIGFVAGQLVNGDAQRLDNFADLRELVSEVIRHPLPGRLVLGVLLVSEGGPWEVESDRHVVRLQVGDPP